jgi:tRNA A37 threonylcarbamoyladenosine dehydratase
MALKYARCETLFGDNFTKIQNAKVLLLGVGGVGSYCLDALIRTGVSDITIIDCDVYDETNQNRQIGSEAVGEEKVFHLAKLYPTITPHHLRITKEWVHDFDFSPYDVVLDCIDNIPAKVAIAKKCFKKLICSTGSAKRVDPTKIEVASIWKTHGDPLASKLRYELKKAKFDRNFKTIFSWEEAKCLGTTDNTQKGSFVGVTGSFGLILASEAIKKICEG